jgi:hypothetical protein
MAWTPLASRLASLPLVLTGPILRQVTENSVTVWVALNGLNINLQTKIDVTLTVYDGDTEPTRRALGNATRKATAIGKNLFIVAVTARTTERLVEGKIYFYDLKFRSVSPPITQSLAQAITKPGGTPDPKRIAYPPFLLPSFAMPPADLNKLRLIQGSCRKPNGGTKDRPYYPETPDALGILDGLIVDSATNAYERPHQLLLTGDQIYADEVADVLLTMLTDAGDTLLGWKELLPEHRGIGHNPFGPYEAAKLYPSTRTQAIRNAFFTTQDTRSHLMSLGEYLAMYLFAWSDDLFIPTPTIDEFRALYPDVPISEDLRFDMLTQRNAVEKYRESLPKVRRALANIPSHMICDDHEITDDWNMTRKFCNEVYDNTLGIRIIQNGLIAFAICQSWGNVPEQFWDGSQAAGALLLKSIESVTQVELGGTHVYHTFDAELQQRVGLNKPEALAARNPYGVFHDLDPFITVEGVSVSKVSLRYHFTVEGPSHQVIVTDSRTWRQFPTPGNETHPDLIGVRDLRRQLFPPDAPPLGDRVLMIVLTTNVPPIASIREAAFLGGAGNYYVGKRAGVHYYKVKKFLYDNDLNDSWEFPVLPTDRLFVVVSDKLPDVGGTLTGQAVFLSGDVHFSFASRLAFWAEVQRLGDKSGHQKKVKAVFAQLVASSLKNEKDATRGLQRDGYNYTPAPWMQHITWSSAPAGYVGWNIQSGSQTVGKLPASWIQSGHKFKATAEQPTLVAPLAVGNDVELTIKPHYRYRLDYLATVANGQTVPAAPSIPPPTVGDPKGAAQSFAKATRAHLDVINAGAKQLEVIGQNNLSEITFVWQRANGSAASSVNDPQAINKFVRHTVRWQPPGSNPMWARYDVSLWIDDPNYKPLPANTEPP